LWRCTFSSPCFDLICGSWRAHEPGSVTVAVAAPQFRDTDTPHGTIGNSSPPLHTTTDDDRRRPPHIETEQSERLSTCTAPSLPVVTDRVRICATRPPDPFSPPPGLAASSVPGRPNRKIYPPPKSRRAHLEPTPPPAHLL
jgi:hypothetical protein